MHADFSVECGAGDDCLEFPWASGELRYYDLKHQPELLLQVAEVNDNAELGEFLTSVNSPVSMLESVKCDAWASREIAPEEEIFGATCKFGSYVDLIFSEPKSRFDFEGHENFLRRLVRLLAKAPEISSAADFIVRRCVYHQRAMAVAAEAASTEETEELRDGFGITFYLFGYGDDEDEARCRWTIALKLIENALLQLSATHRRGADQTALLG
jgi:hypothetical protein